MERTKGCPNCGSEIPGDSRFCSQCGAPQALNCAACGHANAAGSRFCVQCGTKLGEPTPASPSAAGAAPATPTMVRAPAGAERRQVTVMFCDLVGSTALSTQLDPEDLRDVIAAYHKGVADTVIGFGGYVAKYMGDGVLVYFGYPEAHETDAENAVRAALALVDAVARLLADDGGHQVRIGLATGLVVVGELVGAGEAQERNVVGETPNLAARLQSIATPNTVVIDAITRRLAGELFDYHAIAPAQLKGFKDPVNAWQVLRERSIASRFEAFRATNQMPLVGREEEMELLLRRWQQIKNNEGRVVLLAGEPGIGKSRLIAALEDQIKDDRYTCLHYFCQPHHQDSALQPVLAQLQHAAGFDHDDTQAKKRGKLERLLAPATSNAGSDIELFAELLGLASRSAETAERDPQARRRKILGKLMEQLEALARRTPVLMLFEDVHWIDPTTLELLTLIIDRLQSLPILLVITFRPEYQPPWAGQAHVTMLTLSRLSQRERAKLVDHVAGGKALPKELLDQIVERTDGVPLFVEELTKSVLESTDLSDDGNRPAGNRPMPPLAIPTTLQASLMSRVDRLGSAREVLQIGAAIGREFSYELIAAVAGQPDPVLQDALIRLTEAELVYLRGTPPNATYIFKHALIQEAAYSNMLRTRRQQLHAAIAALLEKRFSEVLASTPEVIAQQFERAGQSEKAIAYWQQAGERDLRRFALKESMAHYSNALRMVTTLADTPQRSGLELGICLGLAMATQMALGPASTESGAHYEHALTLSGKLPDRGRERFLATWGVWMHRTMSRHTADAFALADKLVAIARELDDRDLLLEAYHAYMPGLLWRGNLRGTEAAALEVIRLYDRERHRDHAYYFGGHDARVCAQGFYSLCLWGLGHFDRAQQMVRQCIADARALGHAFSLAHSFNLTSRTLVVLDDVPSCRGLVQEFYEIAERNRFPWPLAQARMLRGWLTCCDGDYDTGIELMLKAVDEPSARVHWLMLMTWIAERQFRAGRIVDALRSQQRALAGAKAMQDEFYQPETIRLRGDILLAQSAANIDEAEAAFRRGLALAAEQSCRAIELRASISLARLLAESGRNEEAREILAPVYATFTEGFDRPDLIAAKALLAQLV
jgi:class 3 adenylate cyclase/tetratricopeptide (TPR) repeat protein